MQTALEDDAIRSICVSGADEAMAAVADDRPDAALVDVCLPETSGLELANDLILAGIPVLIYSGHPGYQKQLAANRCRFLSKPFRLEELYAELRLLLDDATEHNRSLAEGLELLARSRKSLADVRKQNQGTAD
jgi:DNA-binding NtrC family response regulator